VASRAGVSLGTRYKCGLGQLGPGADGPGPGERQGRQGGELGAGSSASWHVHRDKVTRGLSSLPAHHLAFSLAFLAQAHQHQARAVPNCTYIGSSSSHRLVMPRRGLEAGRIYGSPWLETGTHRFPRAHPCSFDAPRARIARLEALKCNASHRFYSAARCAEVRSWPQVVENDERLIDARPKSREGKVATNCAAQAPASILSIGAT